MAREPSTVSVLPVLTTGMMTRRSGETTEAEKLGDLYWYLQGLGGTLEERQKVRTRVSPP